MRDTTFSLTHLLIVGCTIALTSSTGCRSGKSPLNLFSLNRNEPSPEVLAGKGPSATYPVPPSTSVDPQAIASVPGGTSGSPGISNSPITQPTVQASAVANQGLPNHSAAQANGFRPPNTSLRGVPDLPTKTASAPMNKPNVTLPNYRFGNSSSGPEARTASLQSQPGAQSSSYTIPKLPALPNNQATQPKQTTLPPLGVAAPKNPGPVQPSSFSLPPNLKDCLLYTSPSPRDLSTSRMPSSA